MSQNRAQMQLLVEADMDAIQVRSPSCMHIMPDHQLMVQHASF